jgi:hypothetical protein
MSGMLKDLGDETFGARCYFAVEFCYKFLEILRKFSNIPTCQGNCLKILQKLKENIFQKLKLNILKKFHNHIPSSNKNHSISRTNPPSSNTHTQKIFISISSSRKSIISGVKLRISPTHPPLHSSPPYTALATSSFLIEPYHRPINYSNYDSEQRSENLKLSITMS